MLNLIAQDLAAGEVVLGGVLHAVEHLAARIAEEPGVAVQDVVVLVHGDAQHVIAAGKHEGAFVPQRSGRAAQAAQRQHQLAHHLGVVTSQVRLDLCKEFLIAHRLHEGVAQCRDSLR